MKTAMTVVSLGLVFGLMAGCTNETPDAGNLQPAPPSAEQLPDMGQPVDQAILTVGETTPMQLNFEKQPITLGTCRQLVRDAGHAFRKSVISCLHQGVRVAGFGENGKFIPAGPSR